MKQLTFITGNPNKAEQLGWYLQFTIEHKNLDIPEIQSLNLEEVATAKALEAYQQLGAPVLVEDTALTFPALNGLPGTLIKWFFESIGNEGLVKLLQSHTDRTVIAETCFAVCDEKGVHLFKAAARGTVPNKPKGDTDFGWTPIFIPDGETLTWAEMNVEQHRKTSMRRLAIEKLQQYLEEHYQ